MRRDEPLDNWLEFGPGRLPGKEVTKRQIQIGIALDRIEDRLDHPPEGKPWNMFDLSRMDWSSMIGFAPQDVLRAQELYKRVFAIGGPGNNYIQENLLELLAGAEDVRSVPFWVELVDLKRPRDPFAARRKTLALAALARLVARKNRPAARDALHQLAHHAQADVRASAIYYLGKAYLTPKRPLPADIAGELTQIAMHDAAFLPRFQARAVLRNRGLPVPMDNPGGTYEFKVAPPWAGDFHCVIAARSKNSLDELHWAIQNAFEWDADHLYSFFMNGQLYDDRYAFASPVEGDRPPWASDVVLGELGLTLKHKFVYYFDYGDSHQFEVQVVGIREVAEPGQYPRVLAHSGTPPDQYPVLDE